MSPRSAVDSQAVRRKLEQHREAARAKVSELARPPELGAAQGFGKRVGDGTTEAVGRLTAIGVGSSLEHAVARIDRALEKLEKGSYGQCDECGREIAPARLSAMPESVLCVACARAQPAPPKLRR